MAAYRFEASPSNRAGCQGAECKQEKVKIKKNELRVGTWINTEKIQGWSWRHWGCTTPKVIENIIKAWNELQGDSQEKDYSLLDGYDELVEGQQDKVRKALAQGHVDDEDWNGDVEFNRPGKTGFRARGSKKAAAQESKDDEENTPAKNKSAAKKATDGTNEHSATEKKSKGNAQPSTTKKGAADKKAAGTDKGSAAEKEEPTANAAVDENVTNQENAAEEEPKKRRPGRPRKADTIKATLTETAKKGTNNQTEEASEAVPKKRGRRAKAATTEDASSETVKNGTQPNTEGDNQEEAVEGKPKKRGPGRARKDSTTKPAATDAKETPKTGGRLTRAAAKKAGSPETSKKGIKRKTESEEDDDYVPPKSARRKTEKTQVEGTEAAPAEAPEDGPKPADKE